MKKSYGIVLLFGSLVFLNACKKDWTCKCTYKVQDQTMTYEFVIEDKTKAVAKTECESYAIVGAAELKCELE